MQNIYLVSEIDFSRGFGHIIRLNNLASNFQSQKKIFFLLKKKNKFNDNVLDYPLINFKQSLIDALNKSDIDEIVGRV